MSAFKENLLAGKTAFIAGGTSGINLGIAKRFAQLGARVAVVGRNPEKAANAAASIGAGALGFSCDVRDFAATRTVLESISKQFGALDIDRIFRQRREILWRAGCRPVGQRLSALSLDIGSERLPSMFSAAPTICCARRARH